MKLTERACKGVGQKTFMTSPTNLDSTHQPPAGGIYADGMCLPEEEVSELPSPLVGEGWGEGEGHAAANHQKFTAVVAGTSRKPAASKSDPAKIERARGFEMTANVLDFSKQLSPDKLVCKEDQDETLAMLDHLPIGDFEVLTTPSLLKGHLAPIRGIDVATLKLSEDLEVKQAGVGGLVALIISLILAACSKGNEGDRGSVGSRGAKGSKGEPGESCKIVGYELQCPDGSAIDLRTVPGIKGDKGDPGPKGASGSTGPQGQQGPQGYQGPAGIGGLDLDSCHYISKTEDDFSVSISCADDEFLLHGGCFTQSPKPLSLVGNQPDNDDPIRRWDCRGSAGVDATELTFAYAVCCDLP